MFFGKSHSWGVWGSLLLIALSAVAGGAFDLQFDAAGYAWQLLNWRAMLPQLLPSYFSYSVLEQRCSMHSSSSTNLPS